MNLDSLANILDSAKIEYKAGEPLKDHCTFAIGGPAGLFVDVKNEEQMKTMLKAAKSLDIRLLVLGKGSNVLFTDKGFCGAVMHIGKDFSSICVKDGCIIEAQSGASLKALTDFAYENGLSGLEFAYGIPGSVGGAIYMNAGAYGGEIKDVIVSASHLTAVGECGEFSGGELELSYRHSVYTDKDFVITKGLFKLEKADKTEIKAKMDDYMSRRRDKQPIDKPSAGSTFKRPQTGYASALIDSCGLKGKSVGGAMVSEKHAGFVINNGDASCKDVLDLITIIQNEVKAQTGIELECEVKLISD